MDLLERWKALKKDATLASAPSFGETEFEDDPTPPSSPPSPGAPPPVQGQLAISATNTHPMLTRSKNGIVKMNHLVYLAYLNNSPLHQAFFASQEPPGFKIVAKNPRWLSAMEGEMTALRSNHTWELVPRPNTSNVVGSKWVYRIKYNSDGTVQQFKARLVAQRFSQNSGLDYTYTFSPVVKAATVVTPRSLAE